MKYFVKVEEASFIVTIHNDGTVSIAEDSGDSSEDQAPEPFAVSLQPIRGAEAALIADGRVQGLTVRCVDGADYDVLFPGRAPLRCRVLDEHSRALEGEGPSQGELLIRSPMPGIILDIRVAEGDEVKKGDVLLILEAMKTENEICAELDGFVKKVHITANQTIQNDALLIELEDQIEEA